MKKRKIKNDLFILQLYNKVQLGKIHPEKQGFSLKKKKVILQHRPKTSGKIGFF